MRPFRTPIRLVARVVNITTVILLIGMRIAHRTGLINPWTARLIPTILYRKLNPKLALMILRLSFAKAKKLGIFEKEDTIRHSHSDHTFLERTGIIQTITYHQGVCTLLIELSEII